MTMMLIKEVALRHFAQHGYEGVSMADIADEVGIKKQSIYSHFKGKDELFLQVCRDVFDLELREVAEYFERNETQSAEDFLYGFLQHYIGRYEQNASTKFWLRTSFFPPAHLYEPIMIDVYKFLDQLEERLLPILEKAANKGEVHPEVGSKRAATAFLGVLDGIFVEMLYGGTERLAKRLDASWHVYWRGLSNR